jgi:hypothetical protein
VSDDGVSTGDMSSNLFPFRRHDPAVSADDVDALLSGQPLGPAASPEAQALGEAVSALRSAGRPSELAGASAAMAAFAEAAGDRFADSVIARRRKVLTPLIGAKLVIAAVAGSIALGGAAAAAGISLPGTSSSEHSIAAPASSSADPSATASATESATASATASPSPSPTKTKHLRPASVEDRFLFGLCTAYTAQNSSTGNGLDASQILAKLQAVATAKGVTVDQLCTSVLAAGDPKQDGSVAGHRQGADDPSDDPARGSSGHDGRGQGTSGGSGTSGGGGHR